MSFSITLANELYPLYAPPAGGGGHDDLHVIRMAAMYDELSEFIHDVDHEEYSIAVILHNLDRYVPKEEFPDTLDTYLARGEFSVESRDRIRDAILNHNKRRDDSSDSPLLQMLRLADKWDRISIIGITAGLAWSGCEIPAYNSKSFGYSSTAEGPNGFRFHYESFYRVLEWYTDFSLIRELVRRHPQRFRDILYFVRAWARTVVEAHHIPNTVEIDLKKCLGEYYNNWLSDGGSERPYMSELGQKSRIV